MTKRQKDILNLIRTIHKKETWNQRCFGYTSASSNEELPCGTSCCLAGHIVNQFATKKDKKEVCNYNLCAPDVAGNIIAKSFKNIKYCEINATFTINNFDYEPWAASRNSDHFAKFADALENSLKEETK